MFCKPAGTITVRSFDSIVRVSDGETLVSPDDYTVTEAPSDFNGEIVDRFVFEDTEAIESDFNIGDEIEVIYNGFTYLNTIDKVGEGSAKQYKVAEKLPISDIGTAIKFRKTEYSITFNDINEEIYIVEHGDHSNEQIIIRKTWMKPFIGYQELTGTFSDAKSIDDGRITLLNEQALEEVYCDLSDFGNAYDFIYSAEIRTLQKYKILSILENDFEKVGEESFKIKYQEYLNKFSISGLKRFDEDQDGKPTGGISNMDTSFSL